MKPLNISIITVFLITVLLILSSGLFSCKKITDPYKNSTGKDTITYDLLKTSIYVQFFDASTNEVIIPEEDKELKIQIVGKSKAGIADIVGLQRDEYIAKNGFITLGLLPDSEFTPSDGNPIRFSIIAQLTGYLTSRKEISLTSEGDYLVKIFMVNINNPPSGIIIESVNNVGVLINGVLQGAVSVDIPNNKAKLTIPSGTKLFDKDSTYLAGKLNISLIYYSGTDDLSLANIPGGIVSSVLENNSVNPGVFSPTGIIAYNIYDSDWHKAYNIVDDSIEISMVVSAQSYNPISGLNVIDGDLTPVYSYIADTGLWVLNQWVEITDTANGQLSATVKTQDLDYANFSWFKENNCNQGAKFQISGSCTQCNSVMLDGVIRKQDDNTFVSNISIAGYWDETLNIPLSTGGTGVYINWNESNNCNYCNVNPSVSPLLVDDMCSQQLIELPLVNSSPTSISITANFYGMCPSDTNVLILPSFGLWIRPIDATCWRWSSMKNGVAQICNVIYGERYVLGTYYDGNWKEWEITITEETVYDFTIDFSQSVCTDVFGLL